MKTKGGGTMMRDANPKEKSKNRTLKLKGAAPKFSEGFVLPPLTLYVFATRRCSGNRD